MNQPTPNSAGAVVIDAKGECSNGENKSSSLLTPCLLYMEWISIERKLPESAATLLVAAGAHIALADWNTEEKRFTFTTREDAALIRVEDITHWTPLPEPPKERHNDWDRELLLCDSVTVRSRIPGTPVEYTGKAFDKGYYFKARGQSWRMAIAETIDKAVEALGTDEPLEFAEFFAVGRYSENDFAAGYMPLEQAEEIIRRCVRLWKAAQEEK